MDRWSWLARHTSGVGSTLTSGRLLTDGGEPENESAVEDEQAGADGSDERGKTEANSESDEGASQEGGDSDEDSSVDRANVEVTEAGETTPADPKWEEPDLDEIPEFEVGGQHPSGSAGQADSTAGSAGGQDPTAGRPNEARSPDSSRIKEEGTEGYVAAVELCARLPDDVRLPAEAADLVPAAVEAELEEDIQSFAAAEFDNTSPTVDTLEFVERADELWLRLRLGITPDAFVDLDPDEIRGHALQELEGMF